MRPATCTFSIIENPPSTPFFRPLMSLTHNLFKFSALLCILPTTSRMGNGQGDGNRRWHAVVSGRSGQLALRLALLVPRWVCEAAYARSVLGDPVGVWTSLRIALGGGGRGGEPSAHGRFVHPKLLCTQQSNNGRGRGGGFVFKIFYTLPLNNASCPCSVVMFHTLNPKRVFFFLTLAFHLILSCAHQLVACGMHRLLFLLLHRYGWLGLPWDVLSRIVCDVRIAHRST